MRIILLFYLIEVLVFLKLYCWVIFLVVWFSVLLIFWWLILLMMLNEELVMVFFWWDGWLLDGVLDCECVFVIFLFVGLWGYFGVCVLVW